MIMCGEAKTSARHCTCLSHILVLIWASVNESCADRLKTDTDKLVSGLLLPGWGAGISSVRTQCRPPMHMVWVNALGAS